MLEAKRQQDTLTETERQELITLNDIAEQKNVERMAALAKLAQLRQISLPDLMEQLGIKPPSYVWTQNHSQTKTTSSGKV